MSGSQKIFVFGLLGFIELGVYFNDPGHFFQGDTLYWLANLYDSIREFLAGFFHLDPGGWYRPLSQRTVESAFLPFAGLNPIPYRTVTFGLFLGCTAAIFILIERVTAKGLAAVTGTFFFATHVTQAYTTYDVAFTPELLYTLFYVASAVAYHSYLQQHRLTPLVVSALCFIGSLLSKEAAVTLPFTLAAMWFLIGDRTRARVSSLWPHFLILSVYLLFVVGYLQVGGIEVTRLLENPGQAGLAGYQLVIGQNVVESLHTAVRWAFNYPGGLNGNWSLSASWMFHLLWLFRSVVLAGSLLLLMTPRRRSLLFGICWFLVAVAPMLPLVDHFLPYYLFAPLAGMSLVVGLALNEVYEWLSDWAPELARASLVVLLAMYGAVNATTIWEAARVQSLLGASSQNALEAVSQMRAIYPRLPKAAKLVFVNEASPGIWWNHAQGGLFQIAYGDPDITAQYSTEGLTVTDGDVASGSVRFLKIRNERIERHNPYHVELSKGVVRAGSGSYVMRVPELPDATVTLLYSHNGIAKNAFEVKLDAQGEYEFNVDRTTEPGLYVITGLKRSGDAGWVLTGASIEVLPADGAP